MSLSRLGGRTEHAGPKGRGRKSGYWGPRAEAKAVSKRRRRREERRILRDLW